MKFITVESATPWMAADTHIYADNGSEIAGVKALSIYMEANDRTEISLEVYGMPKLVKGKLKEVKFICPNCDFAVTHECGQSHPELETLGDT